MVLTSHAGSVNMSLASLLPHAEAADQCLPVNVLQEDAAPHDQTSGRQSGHERRRRRTQSVALTGGEMGPKLRSRSAGVLLELMRFDFTGDFLSEMKEHERSVLTSQNVSGETVSSAMNVGTVLNRLIAKHLDHTMRDFQFPQARIGVAEDAFLAGSIAKLVEVWPEMVCRLSQEGLRASAHNVTRVSACVRLPRKLLLWLGSGSHDQTSMGPILAMAEPLRKRPPVLSDGLAAIRATVTTRLHPRADQAAWTSPTQLFFCVLDHISVCPRSLLEPFAARSRRCARRTLETIISTHVRP